MPQGETTVDRLPKALQSAVMSSICYENSQTKVEERKLHAKAIILK